MRVDKLNFMKLFEEAYLHKQCRDLHPQLVITSELDNVWVHMVFQLHYALVYHVSAHNSCEILLTLHVQACLQCRSLECCSREVCSIEFFIYIYVCMNVFMLIYVHIFIYIYIFKIIQQHGRPLCDVPRFNNIYFLVFSWNYILACRTSAHEEAKAKCVYISPPLTIQRVMSNFLFEVVTCMGTDNNNQRHTNRLEGR